MKRRRVLAALGGTGLAAVVGLGIGTKGAVQYTTAQSTTACEDVELSAEWRETYTKDGQPVLLENNSAENSTTTATPKEEPAGTPDGDPAIITLENVLPGDKGAIGFRLTAEFSPSPSVEPTLSIDIEDSSENGVTDPEREADDDPNDTSEGDLEEFLEVKAWKDTGVLGFDALGGSNFQQDPGEEIITQPKTLQQASNNVNGEVLGTIGDEGDSVSVTLRWQFTDATGINKTQGDSVTFTLDIGCQPV